jgi:hypothetical protein
MTINTPKADKLLPDAHFYAWVRVGDSNPEPAAIEGEAPDRRATTLGCPDPFYIDHPDCPCKLLYLGGEDFAEEAKIEAPDHVVSEAEAKVAERKWKKYLKAQAHSYAGFGRRRA